MSTLVSKITAQVCPFHLETAVDNIRGSFRGSASGWSVLPYLCRQVRFSTVPPEPVIPSKKPFRVELVAGKRYSWCTCGHSRKQPFCDGAHKRKAPGLMPLRFVPEEDATVWLCGCKHTNNPPYCDGTHKQDLIVSAPLYEPADP